MAFVFRKSSCVVVGTFNIYIIQPPLLRALGIVSGEKLKVRFETNLTQPGFRFFADELDSTWIVQPDRIVVESQNPLKDCGADVAKVLNALKWTPVTAVGTNSEYFSPEYSSPIWTEIEEFSKRGESDGGCSVTQKTFHLGLHRDGRDINLQLAGLKHGFELDLNVHVESKGKGDQLKTIEFAQLIANEFMDQRREAESLAKQFFLAEVSHEPDSSERDGGHNSRDSESP